MPVLYGIDSYQHVVHLVTVGDASFEEWRNALLAVFSNSSFRAGFDFLSDGRRGPARSRDGHSSSFGNLRDGKIKEMAAPGFQPAPANGPSQPHSLSGRRPSPTAARGF
jgi:hypothetical protein